MIRNFIFCFVLLLGAFSYAQLPGFTLNVVETPETCFGNGVVAVTVDGTASGVTVDYVIYLMPDTTTPYMTGVGDSGNADFPFSFTGLNAGDYLVIATQTSGGQMSSEQTIVVVEDQTNPITSETTEIDDYILCGNDGRITVTPLQGTASEYQLSLLNPATGVYELIQGPQDEGEFTGLSAGVYLVGIWDALCGNLVNMSHTIPFSPLGPVEFLGSEIAPVFGADCEASSVLIRQGIQVPARAFPIIVTFTVYPPDGSEPVILEEVHEHPGGANDPVQIPINQLIPYYPGEYFYDVNVTNVCGDSYSFDLTNQPVFYELEVSAILSPSLCYGIDITVMNFQGGQYSVEFINPDEDSPNSLFLPPTVYNVDPNHIDFGTEHPGPFFYANPMTGEGKVTYGIYPKFLLDDDGELVLDANGNEIPVLVGDYIIKVTDGCGVEGLAYLTIPADDTPPNIFALPKAPQPHKTDSFLDCIDVGDVIVQHQLDFATVYIVNGPEQFKEFLNNYNQNPDDEDDIIPVFAGDGLGYHPGLSVNNPLDISAFISDPKTIMAFPAPPEPGDPRPMFPGLVGLGTYYLLAIDICGNEFELEIDLQPFINLDNAFTLDQTPGCDGLSSVRITPLLDDTAGPIVEAIVISAPTNPDNLSLDFYYLFGEGAADNGNIDVRVRDENGNLIVDDNGNHIYDLLPYAYHVPDMDPTLPGQWHIGLINAPAGDYIIDIKISCVNNPLEFTLILYEQTTSVDLVEGCGVFDFQFNHTANHSLNWPHLITYTLEMYDPVTDTWNPIPFTLVPGQMTYNVNLQGEFRIVKQYPTWAFMFGGELCSNVISEFEFTGDPGIKSIISFACPNGGSEVIVDATGAEPLLYSIVNQNGEVIVDNGESDIFLNLAPGSYIFRVTDDCGSFIDGTHQIGQPIDFEVIENNLCDEQLGSLSVQNYSFFSYEWYKVDEQTQLQILVGTGSQLIFDPFDSDSDGGKYIVKIIYANNLQSCLNQEIEYEVGISPPYAGDDASQDFCHTNQDIDLFSIFTSEYDAGGTWEDVDNTGALQGNVFETQGVAVGTYIFKYVVDTACYGSDDALITINLLDMPVAPSVESFNDVCPGESFELSIAGANPLYTYTWTLPNGNTFTGTTVSFNEILSQDAGNYSVIATLGTCVSPPTTVTVVVKPLAEFTITSSTEICTTLTVIGSNFASSDATYVWTLGGNVVGTNAVLVADEDGEYLVTVTLDGCTSTQTVAVVSPTVVIENGCIDNQFMLSVANTNVFPNATFTWQGPEGFTDSGASINISGEANGDYVVTVTDSQGCAVSEVVTISGTQCMIPKGVSPNGDGLNDTFDLSNFNVNEVKIFNRYGRIVYDKTNGYTNEWNGQSNNDGELPTATYYYHVTFVDGTQKTGWVYLNRED